MKITNRFAALENLNDSDDIKKNTKTSAKESVCLYELKIYTLWFDEECCRFLDQRKQAKMHWLQIPHQGNVESLNNIRREGSRHFRNKKKEY